MRDLHAQRVGNSVELRFTLPQRTTDNLPIREGSLRATVCRGEGEGQPCVPVPTLEKINLSVAPDASAADRIETWQDNLPATEASGPPRLLVYRLQLSNLEGKTAGWSDPAYAAAGAVPQPVSGLNAEETRAGILLRWQSAGSNSDEVLLRRELVNPAAAKKGEAEQVWLESHASGKDPHDAATIDSTVRENVAYRYVALRRRVVTLGQHKEELRSAPSLPVVITWRNAFPPPAPVGLSAAPFAEGGTFAVDLVWEPVEEPGLKGYVVTRQVLDANGAAVANPERLTPQPLTLPAFHDASAKPGVRYRYTVQALSAKGIEGTTATVLVQP